MAGCVWVCHLVLVPACPHLPAWLPACSSTTTPCVCRAFSVAQAVLQAAVGWACARDLPFCFLMQTMVLVAFNKVGVGGLRM